jgi:hypothetical protein
MLKVLMGLRASTERSLEGQPVLSGTEPLFERFKRAGFLVLGVERNRELVVGTVSQPWRFLGVATVAPVQTVEDFVAFCHPGFAKIATSFRLEDAARPHQGLHLRMETRAWVADQGTQRRFSAYWRLMRPASRRIGREWLRRIEQRSLA